MPIFFRCAHKIERKIPNIIWKGRICAECLRGNDEQKRQSISEIFVKYFIRQS